MFLSFHLGIILCGFSLMTYSDNSLDNRYIDAVSQSSPNHIISIDEAAPCITLSDLGPELKNQTEEAYTLYRDQVLFKNYEEALSLWKIAFANAPGANGRVTYHFDDGIKIYDHFFKISSDENQRQAYVDTILSIYDKRIQCFGDDGTVMARKAFNSYYHYKRYVSEDDIFESFVEVVEKKGKNADYFIINPFAKLLYDRVLEEKINVGHARQLTYQIFDIIDYGLETCEGKYCESWEIISEYAPSLLETLEGIKGYFDCNYYMDKYYNQYLEDSTNCENITEVYLKMVWANCDSLDQRMVGMKKSKDIECYVPPPPPGPLKLANEALNQGRFRDAITFYEEFVATTDDPINKADKLLRISKIYYAHIKNFAASRQYALLAAEQRPEWGEPYIIIGKLYASSGPLCGPGRGWDSQIVTWPAIDKFQYAKNIDPSVTEEANKWINRYARFMPSAEDIFQRTSINLGDRFYVGCWIQEWTTVRQAPR